MSEEDYVRQSKITLRYLYSGNFIIFQHVYRIDTSRDRFMFHVNTYKIHSVAMQHMFNILMLSYYHTLQLYIYNVYTLLYKMPLAEFLRQQLYKAQRVCIFCMSRDEMSCGYLSRGVALLDKSRSILSRIILRKHDV